MERLLWPAGPCCPCWPCWPGAVWCPASKCPNTRTVTLFTRLMSTILATENEGARRERFLAIETQLEMAEALIREDMQEVQRLLQTTMEKMGVTKEQLDEMARKIIEQFGGGELPPGENPLFPPPEN